MKEGRRPVLILDPLSSLFLGDENDTREMNGLKIHLEELARVSEEGLLVLLHHTSKAGERGDRHQMYAARGSSILSGWADVQLNLSAAASRKDVIELAVVVAKSRDGERGQEKRLRLFPGEGRGEIAGQVTEEDARQGRILEMLNRHGKPITKHELAGMVRGRRSDTLKAIGALLRPGRLSESDGLLSCAVAGEREGEESGG
jgi:hypothetical protein